MMISLNQKTSKKCLKIGKILRGLFIEKKQKNKAVPRASERLLCQIKRCRGFKPRRRCGTILKIRLHFFGVVRLAKATNSAFFNLSHALAGQTESLADFFQSPSIGLIQTVVSGNDFFFALV